MNYIKTPFRFNDKHELLVDVSAFGRLTWKPSFYPTEADVEKIAAVATAEGRTYEPGEGWVPGDVVPGTLNADLPTGESVSVDFDPNTKELHQVTFGVPTRQPTGYEVADVFIEHYYHEAKNDQEVRDYFANGLGSNWKANNGRP
jgi:hypothetical protein